MNSFLAYVKHLAHQYRHWATIVAAICLAPAAAWAEGGDAVGDTIVFIDGGQGSALPNAVKGDLYIIEHDDITDELVVYVWRDSDGDGAKDRFVYITSDASYWTQADLP